MECFGGDVNRMVCRVVRWRMDWGCSWLGLVGLSLGLGDCVWCVLLLETVAIATISSNTTPPVSHG